MTECHWIELAHSLINSVTGLIVGHYVLKFMKWYL